MLLCFKKMSRRKSSRTAGKRRFRLVSYILRVTLFAAFCFVLCSIILVAALKHINPPTSMFMVKRQLEGLVHEDRSWKIDYQWVDWDNISPHMALSVVASEDQKFLNHWGFDFQSIREAIEERITQGRVRGASTITQQTAKNLFLWEGRSYLRKGVEAWFTVLIETFWSKQRILEVYLNVAEFGDGIYGVYSASMHFFQKSPSNLTRREAALMASVLPNPKIYDVSAPSTYVQQRSSEIMLQMNNLGDFHLKEIK